jgi:hypothetical protein
MSTEERENEWGVEGEGGLNLSNPGLACDRSKSGFCDRMMRMISMSSGQNDSFNVLAMRRGVNASITVIGNVNQK